MKDIKKTYDLRDELGWQMEKTRGKARRELKWKNKINLKKMIADMIDSELNNL